MIATSIEQSYKLLEAGLSPDSADMHWSSRKMEKINGEWRIVQCDLVVGKCDAPNDLPAWSIGKMIDILGEDKVTAVSCVRVRKSEDFIQSIVWSIEDYIMYGKINEKYLKK